MLWSRETGFFDRLNGGALQQLIMELTRRQATPDLILCGIEDLVSKVDVIQLLRNNDHAAIHFNVHVRGKCQANLMQ